MRQAKHLAFAGVVLAVGAAVTAGRWVAARTARGTVHGAAGAQCAPPGAAAPMLSATVVNDALDLALPTRVLVQGEWLVVLDAASDSVVRIIRRADGSLYQSLGPHGRGPGEFHGAWSLSAGGSAGTVSVFDVGLRRVTLIDLPRTPGAYAQVGASLQLTTEGYPTGAAWLDSTGLVAPGFYGDVSLARFGPDGRRIGGLGANPFRYSSRAPLQASQTRMAVRPGRHFVALARRFASVIELVDLERGTSRGITGPVALHANPEVPQIDQRAYVDVSATTRHIVAAFSGRVASEVGSSSSFADCLHVFTWDGTFRAAFRLDSDVLAIAVVEGDEAVYALRHEPQPALIRFEVPFGALPARGNAPAAAQRAIQGATTGVR